MRIKDIDEYNSKHYSEVDEITLSLGKDKECSFKLKRAISFEDYLQMILNICDLAKSSVMYEDGIIKNVVTKDFAIKYCLTKSFTDIDFGTGAKGLNRAFKFICATDVVHELIIPFIGTELFDSICKSVDETLAIQNNEQSPAEIIDDIAKVLKDNFNEWLDPLAEQLLESANENSLAKT